VTSLNFLTRELNEEILQGNGLWNVIGSAGECPLTIIQTPVPRKVLIESSCFSTSGSRVEDDTIFRVGDVEVCKVECFKPKQEE